jgi:hypothetical protein
MSFDRYDEGDKIEEAHEYRIVRCKSCNQRIVFLETAAGKRMPIDADTVEAEDTVYEHGRHVSHFSSCPQAQQHKKPR